MKIFILCFCIVIFSFIPSYSSFEFNKIKPALCQMTDEFSSKQQKQYTLMIFSASWCKPCHWMNAFVFSNPGIKNKMEAVFETIFIDVDTPEGYDLKNKMRIKILPTLLIIAPNHRVVERIEDVMDKNEWNNLLDYISVPNLHPSFQIIKNNSVPQAGEVLDYMTKPASASPSQYPEFIHSQAIDQKIVRLATYTDREEAEQITQFVRKETGIPLWITTSYENGRTQFTLNTGHFENDKEKADALTLLQSLSLFNTDDSENCQYLLR